MPIAVYALAIMAFAIGTTELIVSGILPAISSDLSVSIPVAGLLVTGYAASVAIGGPILALPTSRFPRKTMILIVSLIFAAGQLLCALAPNYSLLLAARLVSACGHGVFFGIASVAISRLVPEERRGSALSLFVGGITVANILGLPIGTAIGNAYGWRTTFVCIAVVALLGVVAVALALPGAKKGEQEEHAPFSLQLRQLGHQQVFSSYAIITTVMIGAVAFGTFEVPLLLEVTHVEPGLIPWFLLLGGAGSLLGILLGGRLADWRPMEALVAILMAQVACNIGLLLVTGSPIGMGIGLFFSALTMLAFSTPVQVRILSGAKAAPNLAATLISAAYNVGIAAGAALGAILLQGGMGYAQMPALGIVCSGLALLMAIGSWMADRRQPML